MVPFGGHRELPAGEHHGNELVIEIGFDGSLDGSGGIGGCGGILDEGVVGGEFRLESEQAEFDGGSVFVLGGEREEQGKGECGKEFGHE